MIGCTIAEQRHAADARVLARTFLAHHPGATVVILWTDGEPLSIDDGVQEMTPVELEGTDVALEAALHGPDGLVPALLRRLLVTLATRGEPVIWIGGRSRVTGALTELVEAVEAHGVVVVPTGVRPDPEAFTSASAGAAPDDVGVYDAGLLGWADGPVARDVLRAWPEALDPAPSARGHAFNTRTPFQRWLDGLPAEVEGVGVLRHPGYALSARNAARHVIRPGSPPTADGLPIRLLRLDELDVSAFVAGRPEAAWAPVQALEAEIELHIRDLIGAGERSVAQDPGAWSSLPDGSRYTPVLRLLFREARQAGALDQPPFSASGMEAFYTWLAEPAPRGGAAGVNRAMEGLWRWRADVQAEFPHLDGADGPRLAEWVSVHGDDLPARLRPHPPDLLRGHQKTDPRVREVAPPFGVNLAGFFSTQLGIGQAARLVLRALDEAHVPALPVQALLDTGAPKDPPEFELAAPDEAPFPITVLCVNGGTVEPFAAAVGDSFFEDRYTIGLWFWELASPPVGWEAAYEWVDEVWVTSAFAQQALNDVPVPVHRVALPVELPAAPRLHRESLGIPSEGFLFLYIYDYHSVEARKNATGLARVFRAAFPPGSGPKLVLKSINGDRCPRDHERVLAAAAGHPDIISIDRYLDPATRTALLAACDCYVSPHRSEGFGLTIAEAMLLGKPVIATGYGGSMEFTNESNSLLLPYRLVPVGPGAAPYPPDAVWADPDPDALRDALLEIAGRPEHAQRMGARAAEDVGRDHSPQRAGATMRERLLAVHRQIVHEGARIVPPAAVPLAVREPAGVVLPQAGAGFRADLRRLRARAAVSDRWVAAALEGTVRQMRSVIAELGTELDRRRSADRAAMEAELRRLRRELEAMSRQDDERVAPPDER